MLHDESVWEVRDAAQPMTHPASPAAALGRRCRARWMLLSWERLCSLLGKRLQAGGAFYGGCEDLVLQGSAEPLGCPQGWLGAGMSLPPPGALLPGSGVGTGSGDAHALLW